MNDRIVIGTRGSALALWQANHVKSRLEARTPGLSVELVVIKTKGDKILDAPLAKVGGKGLFVKEIEEALSRREVDLAVHSMKDVPAELQPGLVLAAVSTREDPHDAVVTRSGVGLASVPRGGVVGTSSLRRVCQLMALRPDVKTVPLRGNVDTRLKKLDAGEFDAIVLAAAGLVRLGHAGRIGERLSFASCLPAIGQGALGLETRAGDERVIAKVREAMHDESAAACVLAERAFLGRLEGGCQTPIAGHATLRDGVLELEGLVGEADASVMLRDRVTGSPADPAALGVMLADRLLARGAAGILARCRTTELVGGE